MLKFDDDRHKFTVAAANSRPQLEFGNSFFSPRWQKDFPFRTSIR